MIWNVSFSQCHVLKGFTRIPGSRPRILGTQNKAERQEQKNISFIVDKSKDIMVPPKEY